MCSLKNNNYPYLQCTTWRVIANSMREVVVSTSKFLKESMNLNWNFQRGGRFKQIIIWSIDFAETIFLGPRRGNACCGTEEN